MRGFGWIGLLILALLIGIGGGMIGYNIGVGVAANVAASGGATVVYPAVGWGFGFFPFFGFLFFFVLLFVVFGAFRRAAWGGGGPGGWRSHSGRGYAEDRFEHWHRRMHAESGSSDLKPDAG
jgi:hypothetical protein